MTDLINQNNQIADKNGITITVLWKDWVELWTFSAEKGKLITTMATENNVEIPMSCGAGACGQCLCEIIEWWEFIDKWNGFMALEENQVLTCIAFIKDEYFDNNKSWKIIIKRTI